MPEVLCFPGTRVGDELRSLVARRRRRLHRLKLLVIATVAAVPVFTSYVWKPPLLLVWNSSASAPIGLYEVRAAAQIRRGDMVIAWTPEPARALAARRHYLPANVPLVKRVAAARGDRVCASGRSIRINGSRVATRRVSDSAGRPMPWWNGCRRLGQGEYFLLMESPQSFDGRYFGITKARDLVGKAVLLWSRHSKGHSHG